MVKLVFIVHKRGLENFKEVKNMNKMQFFNYFEKEDEYLLASIWNDIELCLKMDYPVVSEIFYSINIWKKLSEIVGLKGLKVRCYGLTEESEKRGVVIFPLDFDEDIFDLEYIYFKIDAQNRFKILQHKDFLGSILSLGLKRKLIGDIIVEKNIAYSVTTQNIYNILNASLQKINIVPVKLSIIEKEEIPAVKFKEFTKNITSLRIDSLVSTLANISRSNAVILIEKGDIFINYNVEKSKSKVVEIGTTITIRKVGKFRLENIIGETKKERLKVLFKQYI